MQNEPDRIYKSVKNKKTPHRSILRSFCLRKHRINSYIANGHHLKIIDSPEITFKK